MTERVRSAWGVFLLGVGVGAGGVVLAVAFIAGAWLGAWLGDPAHESRPQPEVVAPLDLAAALRAKGLPADELPARAESAPTARADFATPITATVRCPSHRSEAMERAYWANLAREGLVPKTSHGAP